MNKITIELTEDQANKLIILLEDDIESQTLNELYTPFAKRILKKIYKQLAKAKS